MQASGSEIVEKVISGRMKVLGSEVVENAGDGVFLSVDVRVVLLWLQAAAYLVVAVGGGGVEDVGGAARGGRLEAGVDNTFSAAGGGTHATGGESQRLYV